MDEITWIKDFAKGRGYLGHVPHNTDEYSYLSMSWIDAQIAKFMEPT